MSLEIKLRWTKI